MPDAHDRIDRVEEDGLHHLRVELRPRGADRGSPHRPHPRRQGASDLAGLRLREVAAHGLLPERCGPPGKPDAPQAGRHVRSHRLGDGDPRDRREVLGHQGQARWRKHPVLRRRQPGQSPRRRVRRQHDQGAGNPVPVECARAGEDRRSLGAGQDDRLRHPWRLRALRGRRLRRQEPVAVAWLCAHARNPA